MLIAETDQASPESEGQIKARSVKYQTNTKYQTLARKETPGFLEDKFLFPCPRSDYNSNYKPHIFQQTLKREGSCWSFIWRPIPGYLEIICVQPIFCWCYICGTFFKRLKVFNKIGFPWNVNERPELTGWVGNWSEIRKVYHKGRNV